MQKSGIFIVWNCAKKYFFKGRIYCPEYDLLCCVKITKLIFGFDICSIYIMFLYGHNTFW